MIKKRSMNNRINFKNNLKINKINNLNNHLIKDIKKINNYNLNIKMLLKIRNI